LAQGQGAKEAAPDDASSAVHEVRSHRGVARGSGASPYVRGGIWIRPLREHRGFSVVPTQGRGEGVRPFQGPWHHPHMPGLLRQGICGRGPRYGEGRLCASRRRYRHRSRAPTLGWPYRTPPLVRFAMRSRKFTRSVRESLERVREIARKVPKGFQGPLGAFRWPLRSPPIVRFAMRSCKFTRSVRESLERVRESARKVPKGFQGPLGALRWPLRAP